MNALKEAILVSLKESPKSVWELLDLLQPTLRDFIPTLNSLYKNGWIKTDGKKLYLTKKAEKKIDKKVTSFKAPICNRCKGRRITLTKELQKILKEYKKIAKERPQPTLQFFQGYMKEIDVIARVALMHHYNDVADKKIVLIGDDDLLSVALALTSLPSKIVVLDIDERLINFLEKVRKKYKLEISSVNYNVADPLPKKLFRKFDTFSSEPLESLSGMKAFLSRGVACLKKDGVGYFGLTSIESSLRKWLEIEKAITRMNCVITEIIKDFSAYPMIYETINYETFVKRFNFKVSPNPGINWYKSSLFRIKALGEPKPLVPREKKLAIEFIDKEEDLTHPNLA